MVERLFCIGDIHGCTDRLQSLIQLLPIDRDQDILVFLGDYINRGPDPAGVLDMLVEIQRHYRKTVFLKGNHEQLLIEYASSADVAMVPTLRVMGVETTTNSYGGRIHSLQGFSCFPEEHKEFLLKLRFAYCWNNYVFTHADITSELIAEYSESDTEPIVNQQLEASLLSGRRFLKNNSGNDNITVVCGHTPFQFPLVLPQRICIDTGAVYNNVLTCLELPSRRFYHA